MNSVFLLTTFLPGILSAGFHIVDQWSQLEFEYESLEQRQKDIDSGVFTPGTFAPIDVQPYYTDEGRRKVFVTIPRFQSSSIPVTFGTVGCKKVNGNKVIRPYPSWEWHRNPKSCAKNRMVGVFGAQIDECERLWVLDSGRILTDIVCPPQILAFDLKTNKLVHRYEIPSDDGSANSTSLVNLIPDVRDGKCDEAFIYVADDRGPSILVYDLKNEASWKVQDKSMDPEPGYSTFNVAGDNFVLMDGTFGIALSPYKPGDTDRTLFYHAFSSSAESWVLTSYLRDKSRFEHDPRSSPEVFHTFEERRTTQSAGEAMDENDVMYFALMHDITVECWNTKQPYGKDAMETLADNKTTFQTTSGIKVISNAKGEEEVWVLASAFQKVAAGSMSSNETNFYVHRGKVKDLISGTKCEPLI